MEQLPSEITVVTLNCWGLKYLSSQRRERLAEIGQRLASASPAPAIVGLQECWCQEDYRAIRRATRQVLPYGKFYYAGAFGAGLALLSRWPIEESGMVAYPLNGRPTAFFRGDWFVGKGVACARVRFGPAPADVLEVFNTHTHAPYERGKPFDTYWVHAAAQAWELAKLLRAAAARGHGLVLALGDFNMVPGSLAHRLIEGRAPVRDAWRVLHPDSSLGAAADAEEQARTGGVVPGAAYNLAENGVTSDSAYNTWRWPAERRRLLGPGRPGYAVPPDAADPRGKRLDYVFVSTPSASDSSTNVDYRASSAGGGGGGGGEITWAVKGARVGMVEPHPVLGCSLSDHFSVEVTLSLRRRRYSQLGGGQQQLRRSLQHPPPLQQQDQQEESPSAGTSGETSTTLGDTDSQLIASGTYLQSPAPSVSTHSGPPPNPNPNPTSPTNPNPNPNPRTRDSRGTTGTATTISRTTASTTASTSYYQPQFQPQSQSPHHPRRPSRTSLLTLSSSPPSPPFVPAATYDEILRQTRLYAARERRQRAWRARHFFASLVVTVACLAGVWFVNDGSHPRAYLAFVLMLVSTLSLAAGVVDGLMALLFFGAELRALREFEWEVRNAKAVAVAGGGLAVPVVDYDEEEEEEEGGGGERRRHHQQQQGYQQVEEDGTMVLEEGVGAGGDTELRRQRERDRERDQKVW